MILNIVEEQKYDFKTYLLVPYVSIHVHGVGEKRLVKIHQIIHVNIVEDGNFLK